MNLSKFIERTNKYRPFRFWDCGRKSIVLKVFHDCDKKVDYTYANPIDERSATGLLHILRNNYLKGLLREGEK